MRLAAAEDRERGARRTWGWLPAPLLAAAGVGVLALVIGTRPGNESGAVRSSAPEPGEARRVARLPDAASSPAAPAREGVAVARTTPPQEPPPDLAAAPELFMNLPIIRNMEKLEHFEAISMVELAPNG
jgi:hypothetical protein